MNGQKDQQQLGKIHGKQFQIRIPHHGYPTICTFYKQEERSFMENCIQTSRFFSLLRQNQESDEIKAIPTEILAGVVSYCENFSLQKNKMKGKRKRNHIY